MKKGFTLVELLVVISIIILLTGLVTTNYRAGQKSFYLQRSTQKLASDIRRVEEMAISTREISCGKPDYGIYVGPNFPTNSYILFADCNLNQHYDSGSDVKIEENQLETGVQIISVSPSPLNLTFTPPDPTVNVSGGTQAQILISNSAGQKTITVEKTGLIEIQ